MNDMMIYLKTTETCNLNCRHCFTSGSKGAKIYFDPLKTVDWLHRLAERTRPAHMHIEFHGGEPFLASTDTLHFVVDNASGLWRSQSWGMTSNLTFKLSQDKIDFIKGPLGGRIATSWDPAIRFANDKQRDLWAKNVRELIRQGVELKVNVSVTRDAIALQPITIIEKMAAMGFKEVAFERLTHDGNATEHPDIFPMNKQLDEWFMRMHEQTVKHNARELIVNEFMESVYDKFENGQTANATFCRNCEQKLFTVNADGTIAGCPNSAPKDHYAHINDSIDSLFNNPKRNEIIACEVARDPRCYQCEVFDYCNSDCHQIGWQGDVCGAPKTLMKHLAGR